MQYAHIEWVDVEGLAVVRRELEACVPINPTSTRRKAFLLSYLDAIDRSYGPTLIGPQGRPARSMRCVYSRVREGRLYCRNQRGPTWSDGQPSYICAQGMPRALRPYLMRHWAHDIDIENCHVSLMYQLARWYHLWPEHEQHRVEPLRLESLRELYEHRAEFIEHVANTHGFATDSERYMGYRKDMCKPLFLRLLYGGTYDAWLREHNLFFGNRSQRVMRLQREIDALRMAVLRSRRFAALVHRERGAQQMHSKAIDAIDRGTFSKIAQSLECEVLLAMRAYLLANDWRVLSLVFDGIMVQHKTDAVLDLEAMALHVERETQFRVRIVEKPLYGVEASREELLAVD